MRQEMSFVSLILFIAIGILVFAIIFLFTKRQIARFTLKSSQNPHAPIGSDAPKPLRVEIERRLKRTKEIGGEPVLMSPEYIEAFNQKPTKGNIYLYRMKALDEFKSFDNAIRALGGPIRRPDQSIRQYLLTLLQGPLKTSSQLVHEFADAYENARHDPAVFKERELKNYMNLLNELLEATRTKHGVSRHNSTASSSSATSQTALITGEMCVHYRAPQKRDESMSILQEESIA